MNCLLNLTSMCVFVCVCVHVFDCLFVCLCVYVCRCFSVSFMFNLVSKTHLHPTQVGLGIIQATHCKVIHVSTVYCAVCNLQPVYWSTWLTHEFRHLIVLKLLSAITRNHSTNNASCCFFSSVKLQMMTVPSIDEMILGLSWDLLWKNILVTKKLADGLSVLYVLVFLIWLFQ